MSGRGRNPEISDEGYLEFVKATCDIVGTPMAPTQVIYEKHDLPITDQTLKNNLERLSDEGKLVHIEVGKGFAWSIPEEDQAGGGVDFEKIDWDVVDVDTIPTEIIKEHPDYKSLGDRHVNKADNVVEYAVYFTLVGLIILLIDNTVGISNATVVDVGSITFVAGLLFIMFGMAAIAAITFIEKMYQSDAYNALKETIVAIIPIRIEKEENSLTISWK